MVVADGLLPPILGPRSGRSLAAFCAIWELGQAHHDLKMARSRFVAAVARV
jgi:hypothetical protein